MNVNIPPHPTPQSYSGLRSSRSLDKPIYTYICIFTCIWIIVPVSIRTLLLHVWWTDGVNPNSSKRTQYLIPLISVLNLWFSHIFRRLSQFFVIIHMFDALSLQSPKLVRPYSRCWSPGSPWEAFWQGLRAIGPAARVCLKWAKEMVTKHDYNGCTVYWGIYI